VQFSDAVVKPSVTVTGIRGLQMQCVDKKWIQRALSLVIDIAPNRRTHKQ